ncbi:Fungal specific transcription factor domain-containing protein isoform 2 [Cladophialophora immunda]|nr:Fungal specific transcription factor domain-containing protein isoform 2 [Cladophialophora immunda]
MQPTNSIPKRLASDVPPSLVSVNQSNPRQRNRIHNQAIKRAKANIGKRRDHIFSTSSGEDTDPKRVIDPLLGLTRAGIDPNLTVTAIAPSPRLTVTSVLQHYAPVHINPRKEQLGPADSLLLSRRYFGLALENASMFELMVALAQASYDARRGNTREPTREVLVHYGKGVEALRLKMARSSACDDDATILAVMALLGIALIYNDFVSFETHLIGLRHLVEMRGGVDYLGWDGFLKNSITGLESLWAYHENKKLRISTTEASIKLQYPRHPFPPDLCTLIAKLPDGFREVALSGSLCVQIITMLSYVSEWVKQLQGPRKKGVLPLGDPNGTYMKQTQTCLELVPLRGLNTLERVLCSATAAVTTETFRKSKQQNPVHRRLVESLSEMLARYNLRDLPPECTIWMALVIAGPPHPATEGATSKATSANNNQPHSPRNILLDRILEDSSSARNWKWVKKSITKFFWSEDLVETWRQTWELGVLRYTEKLKERQK